MVAEDGNQALPVAVGVCGVGDQWRERSTRVGRIREEKGEKEESTVVRRAVVEDVVRMHHGKGIKKGWQHRPTERNRQDNKQKINNKG